MKGFRVLLIVVFAGGYLPVKSQNAAPVITNVVALADTVLHKMNIHFDVSDAESDFIEVFLGVSSDRGTIFGHYTQNATGDIGRTILQGQGKYIEWYYPDSLSGKLNDIVVKLTATDLAEIDIQQIVNQIDSNRLKQNLQMIEGIRHRNTGFIHLRNIQDSIVARFQQHGLNTRLHQFPYGSYTGKNIIGQKSGAGDNITFIVDGHYDTVDDSPGADDNGSSIAGILEIIRILEPLDLRDAVEFIAFDLEEAGLTGSGKFVQSGLLEHENIAGVINMDMIGYYTERPNSQVVPAGFEVVFPDLYAQLVANNFAGNFIISTGNAASGSLLALFDSLAVQYVPDLLVGSLQVPGNGELIPDSRRSDHVAFWDAGYKALHLSDGAETRNPNYHDPTDVDTAVNYTFMRNVTMAVAATILNLARPIHATSITATVSPDPHSSVFEISPGCTIIISPNPVNRHLGVNAKNCGDEIQLRIISLDGKIILKVDIPQSENFRVDLTEPVVPGVYIVEATSPEGMLSQKIVIKNSHR